MFQIGLGTCLYAVICPAVPLGASSIICLDDFTMFWFVYTLLCIMSTDIWDPMLYHKESLISFAFSSMSCILLNSAVIPCWACMHVKRSIQIYIFQYFLLFFYQKLLLLLFAYASKFLYIFQNFSSFIILIKTMLMLNMALLICFHLDTMFPCIMQNQSQKAAHDITSSYKVYAVETTIPTLSPQCLTIHWGGENQFISLYTLINCICSFIL